MGASVTKFCENVVSCLGAPYVSPGSTDLKAIQKGAGVDCSGLLVAAAKPLKVTLYHGSNSMWRKDLTEKGSISDHKSSNGYPKNVNPLKSSQLQVGMAVFKWNSSDPKGDGLGDYQHVGVVTGVNPLRITHATTEGSKVVTDKTIGKWCAWGRLKGFDYNQNDSTALQDEETEQEETTMDNPTGKLRVNVSLNVRAGAGTNYDRVGTLTKGAVVEFQGVPANGWVQVSNGWICTEKNYVTIVEVYNEEEYGGDDDDDDDGDDDLNTLDSFEKVASEINDIEAQMEELCEASATKTSQITAICRILKAKGFDISGVPGMRI